MYNALSVYLTIQLLREEYVLNANQIMKFQMNFARLYVEMELLTQEKHVMTETMLMGMDAPLFV